MVLWFGPTCKTWKPLIQSLTAILVAICNHVILCNCSNRLSAGILKEVDYETFLPIGDNWLNKNASQAVMEINTAISRERGQQFRCWTSRSFNVPHWSHRMGIRTDEELNFLRDRTSTCIKCLLYHRKTKIAAVFGIIHSFVRVINSHFIKVLHTTTAYLR